MAPDTADAEAAAARAHDPDLAARRAEHRARLTDLTTELPAFLTDKLDVVPPESDEDAETVEALMHMGVPEADARAAVAEDRVALLLAARVLDETPVYSLERLSRKSGVPDDLFVDVLTTLGVPVPGRFSRNDLETARDFGDLLEVVSPGAILRSARARGLAVSSIVGADMEVVREELILPLRQAGADDLTVAVALAEAMKALSPLAERLLVSAYRMHLRRLLQSEISHMAARGVASQLTLAVGFVDLVGYTTLAERVDPAGLDAVLEEFESRVVEVVAQDREVALVKYLGDAAMFVAPDAHRLAPVMLDLCQEHEGLAEVPIRGGLAVGEVLIREGDYFGAPVNLAARLTDASRPWRLLTDEASGEALREAGYRTHRLRSMRLRGIGSVRPVAILDAPDRDSVVADQQE